MIWPSLESPGCCVESVWNTSEGTRWTSVIWCIGSSLTTIGWCTYEGAWYVPACECIGSPSCSFEKIYVFFLVRTHVVVVANLLPLPSVLYFEPEKKQ